MQKSFNGLFAFLGVQFIILLSLPALDIPTLEYGRALVGGPVGLEERFFESAAIIAIIVLAWGALRGSVETNWGISARIRIDRWLVPALAIEAGLLVAAAAVVLATRHAQVDGIDLRFATDLTLLLPLSATALLLVSAGRRWQAIRRGLAEMRLALAKVGAASSHERIAASIAGEAGESQVSVRADTRGFTFAGLTSKPWHDPKDFAWLPAFVEEAEAIRHEAETVLLRHREQVETYHYVGLEGDFWKNFSFAKRHREITENLALCPTTAKLLRTIPGYPGFRDAMFSILEAGGRIRPHRDVSNVFLTLHLPLVVPGPGHIEVAGIRREWRYAEPLIFELVLRSRSRQRRGRVTHYPAGRFSASRLVGSGTRMDQRSENLRSGIRTARHRQAFRCAAVRAVRTSAHRTCRGPASRMFSDS